MPQYKCLLCDPDGKKMEIVREMPDENALIHSFSGSNSFLIRYQLLTDKKTVTIKKRFSKKAVIAFTDIISALLSSGLSVQVSLEMCLTISLDKNVKRLAQELYHSIIHGDSLYMALKMFPSSFSPLYRGLVRLGEKTGNAAAVFKRISQYLHKTQNTHDRTTNALLYPVFVLFMAIVGCIGLIIFIIPRISDMAAMFNTSNTEQFAKQIHSMYVTTGIFFSCIIGTTIAVAVILLVRKRSETFAEQIDTLLLRVPFIGSWIAQTQTLDFAFSMEMLTGSGIPIDDALQESVFSLSNRAFRKAVGNVYTKLLQGRSLSVAFLDTTVFPDYVGTWIAIGEKTGAVENVFSQIRIYFQAEVEKTSGASAALIEPILILLAGIFILGLIAVFILPIFSLLGTLV